ncbi:MAG: hypothetical protein HXS52_12050 [Theionarchaea archaeon]|nr:hypothetical protein [Theionarchaea archaeon]
MDYTYDDSSNITTEYSLKGFHRWSLTGLFVPLLRPGNELAVEHNMPNRIEKMSKTDPIKYQSS